MKNFYVFEHLQDLTYRLVPNEGSTDGCWPARDASHAIRVAADRTPGIYAATDGTLTVESWPLTMSVVG